ncbi:MAG: hypothetical protein LBC03_02170 [Nitrososphaerota archaeon]|jgi:guanylate kinase|nr:hypothetical protein [Nitrososphaerota archaeon]
MARLIIVAGASGAGKSFLLEQLARLHKEIQPVKKMTTRPARTTESANGSLDLLFSCSDVQVQNCDYVYHYCEHNYGIKKSDIDSILAKGQSPIVIVARCSMIERIKDDYKASLVLYIQNVLSGKDLEKVLTDRGDPVGVEQRIQRQKDSLVDFVGNINKKLFDYILINDFSDMLMAQVQNVFEKERMRGADSNYVFVIMSFKPEYNEIYTAYKNAAQLLKRNRTIKIQRVDDEHGDFLITERIEACIERAGLVLCDVSEVSSNVFYEFGYARAKNKEIIITANKEISLPFDVRNYRTVFYNSPIDLQGKILDELKNHYCINRRSYG